MQLPGNGACVGQIDKTLFDYSILNPDECGSIANLIVIEQHAAGVHREVKGDLIDVGEILHRLFIRPEVIGNAVPGQLGKLLVQTGQTSCALSQRPAIAGCVSAR